MKRLILLVMLISCGTTSYAQDYLKAFKLGLDPHMLVRGAYPDRDINPDKTMALHVFAEFILPQSEYIDFGLKANYTHSLDEWTSFSGQKLSKGYFNWGAFVNVKFLKWGKTYGSKRHYSKHTLYYGVEITQIIRPKLYWSIGTNAGYRFQLNKHVGFDTGINYMSRSDISKSYDDVEARFNGTVSVIYFFGLDK